MKSGDGQLSVLFHAHYLLPNSISDIKAGAKCRETGQTITWKIFKAVLVHKKIIIDNGVFVTGRGHEIKLRNISILSFSPSISSIPDRTGMAQLNMVFPFLGY